MQTVSTVSFSFEPLGVVRYPAVDNISTPSDGVTGATRVLLHLPEIVCDGTKSAEIVRAAEAGGHDTSQLPEVVPPEVYYPETIAWAARQFAHEDSVFSGSHGEFVMRLLAALVYTDASRVHPLLDGMLDAARAVNEDTPEEDLRRILQFFAPERPWTDPATWAQYTATPEARAETVAQLMETAEGRGDVQLRERERLQHAARRVFFGYRVFGWDTRQVKRDIGDTRINFFADTIPAWKAAERLAGDARVSYNGTVNTTRGVHLFKNAGDFIKTYQQVARRPTPGRRAIVAGDASYVVLASGDYTKDVWLVTRLYQGLSSQDIPIYTVEDTEEVLRALMDLAPGGDVKPATLSNGTQVAFDGAEVSVCPYMDMRFGAWPPWLSLSGEYAVAPGNFASALAYTPTPAAFFGYMFNTGYSSFALEMYDAVRARYVENPSTLEAAYSANWVPPEIRGDQPAIEQFYKTTNVFFCLRGRRPRLDTRSRSGALTVNPADPEEALAVAVGNLGVLRELLDGLLQVIYGNSLTPEMRGQLLARGAVWTKLTTRRMMMLFGPPLHLFAEDRMPFNTWVFMEDAFRMEPDAPKLQTPAKLAESTPEEAEKAQRTFAAIARDWFTADAPIPKRWQAAQPAPQGAPPQEQNPSLQRGRNTRGRWWR